MDSFVKIDESIRNSENPTRTLFETAAYLLDPRNTRTNRMAAIREMFNTSYRDKIYEMMGGRNEARIKVRYPRLMVGVIRALYRIGMFGKLSYEELDRHLGRVFEMPLKDSSIRSMFYDKTSVYDELEKTFAGYKKSEDNFNRKEGECDIEKP